MVHVKKGKVIAGKAKTMDRVILHCDCNSFFASVESAINPEYKKVPLAVCGEVENRHGIVLAKNDLAKAFGVKTTETVYSARKKCPKLVVVQPHYELYAEYSRRANEILESTFKKIKTGMTEKEIAKIVKDELKTTPDYFKEFGVVNEDFSWGEPCPIVLVGKNLKLGGHTSPSDTVFKKGDTIYFDFGVKLTIGKRDYCSDIQRMGYALKEGEEVASKEVQEVFDTLVYAIKNGKDFANNSLSVL